MTLARIARRKAARLTGHRPGKFPLVLLRLIPDSRHTPKLPFNALSARPAVSDRPSSCRSCLLGPAQSTTAMTLATTKSP
jgi:hypothetical protein